MVSRIRGSWYCKLQIQRKYVWQSPVFELIVSHNIAKWCQTANPERICLTVRLCWLIEPGCIMKLSVPHRRHIGRKHLKMVFLKFLKRKLLEKSFWRRKRPLKEREMWQRWFGPNWISASHPFPNMSHILHSFSFSCQSYAKHCHFISQCKIIWIADWNCRKANFDEIHVVYFVFQVQKTKKW